MAVKRATVFGGSGFVGRHIVKRLAARGIVVRVAVRDPDAALFLKPMGAVGQVVPVYGDVADERSVAAAVDGADWVIDTVGFWRPQRRRSFADVHGRGARFVARHTAATSARRLVLISGIGASENSPSAYVRSRAAGEKEAREAFPGTTVLRPSIVFGPGDAFFTRIAAVARYAPVFPVIGGDTRLQPVYVGDVADAAMACLDDNATAGGTYELGGPVVYRHRELIEKVLDLCDRRRLLVGLPFWAANLMAGMASLVPGSPIDRNVVELLRRDNVAADGAPGLAALDVSPTAVDSILPTYMDRFRRGGRWKRARLA
jgi:uncharacterized protein YbjT (DUF2867 family)